MLNLHRLKILFFSPLLICMLGGCQTLRDRPYDCDLMPSIYGDQLIRHPCPLVSYPSKIGYYAGKTLSMPLVVPFFPIWALGCVTHLIPDDQESILYLLAPMILSADIGQTALGAPPWLLFDWWLDRKPTGPDSLTEDKNTEQLSTGTTTNDTNPKNP